jgi:tetratricopeptide (TPR) repeat protein
MSETRRRDFSSLDSRVDELGERIAKVEGRLSERTPPRKLFAEYGGYIALVISILIGGWTLYDNAILQPIKDKAQAESTLRNNLNSLGSISARIARAFSENVLAGNAELASATPQRLALLAEIEKAERSMPHVLNFADRLLLAAEYEQFGDIDNALRHVDLAKANDVYQQANSDWRRARLLGAQGRLEAMRDSYRRALDGFKTLGLKKTAPDVLRLYGNWVGLEVGNDQCNSARNVYAQMVQDFRSSQVLPPLRVTIRGEFEQLLEQLPQDCQLRVDDLATSQ